MLYLNVPSSDAPSPVGLPVELVTLVSVAKFNACAADRALGNNLTWSIDPVYWYPEIFSFDAFVDTDPAVPVPINTPS